MLTAHLKLWLAGAAALAALTALAFTRDIAQGTGLIVATLAAGAGYLIRDVNDEARTLRTICQAYASLIEAHFEEINDALSDAELGRLLALAPAIAEGREPEAIGARARTRSRRCQIFAITCTCCRPIRSATSGNGGSVEATCS